MTVGEAIERVQELYNKGVRSDDTRLSDRFVYSKLKSVRSILLEQLKNKKKTLSSDNYTVIDCIKLIKVNGINCPCIPITGCKVYRTEFPLPTILQGRNSLMIEYVSSLDNTVLFTSTTRSKYKFSSGNRFPVSYYIYEEGYLYIYGKNLPSYIMVKAVLEDVTESYEGTCDSDTYTDCTDCNCKDARDKEFSIQGSLIEPLIELTNKEIIGIFPRMVEDVTNNNRDSDLRQTK